MSKYFSYCPECGFDTHKKELQAKGSAQDCIDHFRDNAEDGWSDDVSVVSWGMLKQEAEMFDEKSGEEAIEDGVSLSANCDFHCDYRLADIKESNG